ncbi:MAG: hypothetical protein ACSLFH_16850 [Desulfuromonadales bacterium]
MEENLFLGHCVEFFGIFVAPSRRNVGDVESRHLSVAGLPILWFVVEIADELLKL